MTVSNDDHSGNAAADRLWQLYQKHADATHPDVLALLATVSDQVRVDFHELVDLRKDYCITEPPLLPGDRYGSVQIVRLLRRGGSATVYEGRQYLDTGTSQAPRSVAFKVIAPSDEGRDYLDSEVRALARIQSHAQIVTLYTVETLGDGRFGLAFELIECGRGLVCSLQELLNFRRGEAEYSGESLIAAKLVSESLPNPLTPNFVVQWLRPVVSAIEFAHGKGATHRDIKPGNLLIRKSQDGFELLLADWGLGKLRIDGDYSDLTSMVGTLRYMAPEVFDKCVKKHLLHRVDVYSFGLVLSELLTLRKPSLQSDLVREDELRVATPVLNEISRDLTTIIDRCTDRIPERRVASFAEISRSFDLYLAGKPIAIRRQTRLERFWYALVTSPVLSTSLSAAFLTIAAFAFYLFRWNSWSHEVQEATIISRDSMNGDDAVYAAGAAATLHDLVADSDASLSALAQERFNWSRRMAPMTIAQFSWPDQQVESVRFDPTGQWLIASAASGLKRIWDVQTATELSVSTSSPLTAAEFASDGRRVLGFQDGTVLAWSETESTESNPKRIKLDSQIEMLALHPTTMRVAVSHAGGLFVWYPQNEATSQVATTGESTHLEFSTHDDLLLVVNSQGLVEVFDLKAKPINHMATFQHRPEVPVANHFCSYDKQVLVISGDSSVEYFDVDSGKLLQHLTTQGKITSAAMRSKTRSLAVAGDGWMSYFMLPVFSQQATLTGHDSEIGSLQWTNDEEMIVSTSTSGAVRGWYPGPRRSAEWLIQLKQLQHAASDGNGRRIATLQSDGIIRVWELPHPWRSQILRAYSTHVSVSPDGRFFVPARRDSKKRNGASMRVRSVEPASQEMPNLPLSGTIHGAVFRPGDTTRQHALFLMGSPNRLEFKGFGEGRFYVSPTPLSAVPLDAEFTPSGNSVVVLLNDGNVHIVDPDTGLPDSIVRRLQVATSWTVDKPNQWLSIAPDGQHFATWGLTNEVGIWNLKDGSPIHRLEHELPCRDAEFSPDGKYLAAAYSSQNGGESGEVIIWSLETRKPLHRLAHRGTVVSIQFSSDSQVLMTGSRDRSLRLWNPRSGELIKELVHKFEITDAVFLERKGTIVEGAKVPSNLLAAVTAGFTLELWHSESGERLTQPLQLRGKPLDVEYSALHDTLLIAGEGNDIESIRLSRPDDVQETDSAELKLRPFAHSMTDFSFDAEQGLVDSRKGQNAWGQFKDATAHYSKRLREPSYREALHKELESNASQNDNWKTAHYHRMLFAPVNEEPIEDSTKEPPPMTADEWRLKAIEVKSKGDWAAALAMYNNVIQLSPPHHSDFDFRSILLFDQQRFTEALSDCEKSIELRATTPYVRLRRARCLTYLSRWDSALTELNGLVNEFPEDRDCLAERAEVNGYMKHWSACRGDYRSLTLQFNDSLSSRYGYAIACACEGLPGEFELACREFYLANRARATPVQILNTAVLYATCSGLTKEEHAKALQTFSSKWTQSDYYDSLTRGALGYRLGNLAEALTHLTSAVEKTKTGGTPLDLSFLAMCQIDSSDLEAASGTISLARKSFQVLQQGLTRGLVRERKSDSVPIGDISSWPNYAQSLLLIEEAEKRLLEKKLQTIHKE